MGIRSFLLGSLESCFLRRAKVQTMPSETLKRDHFVSGTGRFWDRKVKTEDGRFWGRTLWRLGNYLVVN
jgi:hypothetical protein